MRRLFQIGLALLSASLIAGCSFASQAVDSTVGTGHEGRSQLQRGGGMLATQFTTLAEQLYSSSSESNQQLAFGYYIKLDRLLANPQLRSQGSAEGWALIDSHSTAIKKAFKDGKPAWQWSELAARLLLAADSLAYGDQALWLSYSHILADDLTRARQQWGRHDGSGAAAADAAMAVLHGHFNRVETAAQLQRGEGTVHTVSVRLAHIQHLLAADMASNAQRRRVAEAFDALEDELGQLFQPLPEAALAGEASGLPLAGYDPPFWRWSLLLGTIIASVLAYVSWRKYKQEITHFFRV